MATRLKKTTWELAEKVCATEQLISCYSLEAFSHSDYSKQPVPRAATQVLISNNEWHPLLTLKSAMSPAFTPRDWRSLADTNEGSRCSDGNSGNITSQRQDQRLTMPSHTGSKSTGSQKASLIFALLKRSALVPLKRSEDRMSSKLRR